MWSEEAIWWVVKNLEGGGKYVNDPNDPGGPTKWGIAQNYHPGVVVRDLTWDDALAIYEREYWHPQRLSLLKDLRVVRQVLGFVIHLGGRRAIRVLQSCLRATGRHTNVDGVLGPNTADKVNEVHPDIMVPVFKEAMAGWYRAHKQESPYLRGFLNRAYNKG